MNILVFDSVTGLILRVIDCPSSMAAMQCGAGESYIEGNGGDTTHYIDLGGEPSIKEKGELILSPSKATMLADGLDFVSIAVPVGVDIRWPDGEQEAVTDGVVELAADQPGAYKLIFSGVKYLELEVSIEAIAQS